METITSLAGDTIVAIATAPGRGGIGIIRLSGPRSGPIGEAICRLALSPRQATYSGFYEAGNESALDTGIALFFPSPHSFTGEDVVELQAHGGPVVLDLLLKTCCDQGARLARAGEFSERAFLNNKLDLTQAEAIADLINSTTEIAARSASRSLQGAFSATINTLSQQILQLRIYVEAAIDFPEEEIDFIKEGEVSLQLSGIRQQLENVLHTAKQGSLLREGIKLVIAGKPNAGKSSLLNALSGQETAIVTPIEGTTRDVLREHIQIDGIPLHIVDTAGLRTSEDTVEQEGIRRAWQEIKTADHILLVTDIDATDSAIVNPDSMWPELHQQVSTTIPVTIIRNKCDLAEIPASITASNNETMITLSAKTGAGIDLLQQHIKQVMGYQATNEQQFLARRRHLDALQRCQASLQQGQEQLSNGGAAELLAEDLRQAHQCLGEITGAMSSDELLGEIFSSFCIGK